MGSKGGFGFQEVSGLPISNRIQIQILLSHPVADNLRIVSTERYLIQVVDNPYLYGVTGTPLVRARAANLAREIWEASPNFDSTQMPYQLGSNSYQARPCRAEAG
jgi:hypothetical protein